MNTITATAILLSSFLVTNAYAAEASPSSVQLKAYEVTVQGDRNDSREDVMHRALYKAAKKTLKENQLWFQVIEVRTKIDRENRLSGFERVPHRKCGLLGCSTTYSTHYRSGFESNTFDREDTYHSVTLEYQMGSGDVAYGKNIYDAYQAKKKYK